MKPSFLPGTKMRFSVSPAVVAKVASTTSDLGEDVADVALLHQPVDVVLDHPQIGKLVADSAQGFGRDQVGVAEHDQVGADGQAEVEKGAVGRFRAGGQVAEQGAGARDVAVGEVRHRVAVANEPVGDLVLDPVLEGALGFSAEV